jgi:hypothetical protein
LPAGSILRQHLADQIAHTREREPQLGLGSGADFCGNRVGRRERGPRGVGNAGKVLRFDATAQQDSEAHAVGNRVQQRFTGIQAIACVEEIALTRVKQAEVAQELTFRAPVAQPRATARAPSK